MVERKRGRPAEDPSEKRRRLMEAGVKVFLEKGYHPARIEDLVAAAGLGKGTFYLSFESKEALLLALVDSFFEEIRGILAWVFENVRPGVDAEELLGKEAEKVFQTLLKRQDLARVLFREGKAAGPVVEKRIAEFYSEILKLSTETLRALKELGVLKNTHPESASAAIIGAVEKTYELWLAGELKAPAFELVTATFRFLLRAIS